MLEPENRFAPSILANGIHVSKKITRSCARELRCREEDIQMFSRLQKAWKRKIELIARGGGRNS